MSNNSTVDKKKKSNIIMSKYHHHHHHNYNYNDQHEDKHVESSLTAVTVAAIMNIFKLTINVTFCNLFNLHQLIHFVLFLNVILLLPICESLKILQVSVPRKSIVGDKIWLNCSIDLEQDTLYSIKWYKDQEEIYRFLPSNRPSQSVYETDGLFIDVSALVHLCCFFAFYFLQEVKGVCVCWVKVLTRHPFLSKESCSFFSSSLQLLELHSRSAIYHDSTVPMEKREIHKAKMDSSSICRKRSK